MTDSKGGDGRTAAALSGFRVVDCTRVLGGPYCTQILADHGADVIKVEPPQGDETRDWGPPFKDGSASYFIGINRNKRSIGLDLKRDEGRAVLLRLLDGADVLIENFKTGTMEAWGLGYQDVLEERFPALIHCRISGYGADGPMGGMVGYDAAVQANCGLMSLNGNAETGPMRLGTPMVDLGSGLYAAIAILMAAFERQSSGQGQFIDMTLFDSGLALTHSQAANWLLSGRLPELLGNAHPNVAPYDKFATKSGDIFLAVGNDGQFRRLCAELGTPELAEDERFATPAARNSNRPALRAAIEGRMAGEDAETLCRRLLAVGVPAGPVLDIEQVMTHPHTRHRDMVVEMGDYRGTGTPIKFSRTPARMATPPPAFGADGRVVLAEFGYEGQEIEALIDAGVVVEERRSGR